MSDGGPGRINLNLEDSIQDELDDRLPLFRKKKFDSDLARFSREAVETSNSLTMLMVDLDHFKKVNDIYGHTVGDEVLLGASKVVADRVQGKGKAYRFGGEEFAVLLPRYMSVEGITLAEIIRKQVEQSLFSEKNLNVTASLGVAALPEHVRGPSELVKAADSALYQAKELGRNLVRVFGEAKPAEHQRIPERKSAQPGIVSDDDLELIRIAHFSGRQPE